MAYGNAYIDFKGDFRGLSTAAATAGRRAGKDLTRGMGQEFNSGFKRDVNGKLRDAKGKFVTDSQAMGKKAGDEASKSFGRGFKRLPGDLGRSGDDAGNRFSRGFRRRTSGLSDGLRSSLGSAARLGAAAIGAGVVLGLGAAVKTAIDFEKRMSAVGAVSNATAGQMDQLREKALKLGADTAFTASEASGAMEELVKAGLSISDVLGGAADATVALAAAGEVELAEAATIASNAMNQFSLTGADMAHVADIIAGAANASAIDVGQFGFSLAQSGATAALAGLSFDDTALAIAALGNAGIVGSDAGTSLKAMLNSLQPTTAKASGLFAELGLTTEDGSNRFYDAAGNIKSLTDVAGILGDSLEGLTAQQRQQALETIFGSDAQRAGAVFAREGAAGLAELAKQMGQISAEDVAEKRLDNLAGSIEKFKGSLESVMISTGSPLLGFLRGIVDWGTKALNFLSDPPKGFRDFFEDLGRVISPVVGFLKDNLVPVLAFLGVIVAGLIGPTILGGLVTVFTAISGVLLGPIGLIAALVAGVIYAYQHFEAFRDVVHGVATALKDGFGELISFGQELHAIFKADGFAAVIDRITEKAGEVWPKVKAKLSEFAARFGEWIREQAPVIRAQLVEWGTALWQWIEDAVPPVLAALGRMWDAFTAALRTYAPILWEQMKQWGSVLWQWIQDAIPPVLLALGRLWEAFATWMSQSFYPALWNKVQEWAPALWRWIVDVIPDVLAALGRLWVAFATWMTAEFYPALRNKIKTEWAPALWRWLVDVVPDVLAALGRLWVAMATWMTTVAYPAIQRKLAEWGIAFGDWIITTAIPWLLRKAAELWVAFGTWMTTTALPAIRRKLLEWAKAFGDWVIEKGIPLLLEKLTILKAKLTTWFTETAIPWMKRKAGELFKKLVDAANEKAADLRRWALGLPAKMSTWLAQLGPTLLRKARSAVASMVTGLIGKLPSLRSAADRLGAALGAAFDKVPDMFRRALRSTGNVVAGFLRGAAGIASKIGLGPIASALKSAASTADGWGEGGAGGASRGGRGGRQATSYGMARGGVVPFVTDGPRAIVGEGRRAHPEYVIPTDPKYRDRARGLWDQAGSKLGVPQFASGGVLLQAGRRLEAAGARIGEHPAWDKVDRVHANNSRHYTNESGTGADAFDANFGAGSSAREMRFFDEWAPMIRDMGLNVLWRVKDHFNHMHVDVGGGGGGGSSNKSVWDRVSDAVGGALRDVAAGGLERIWPTLPGAPGLKGLIPGGANYMRSGIIDFIKGKAAEKENAAASGGKGNYPDNGSAAAARGWITQALNILGLPTGPWLEGLMRRANQESGFNPNAINRWDSNAKKGTPSKGFLQTIDPTFNAYKLPGYNNIYNPVDNTIAAIRYMQKRYGGVWNLPTGGYAAGGILPTGQVSIHRGNFDQGGTLRDGWNIVNNETGKDEQLARKDMGGKGGVQIDNVNVYEPVRLKQVVQELSVAVAAGRI